MVFLAIDTAAQIEKAVHSLLDHGMQLGYTLIKALIVFMVGRLLINLVNKLVIKILIKRNSFYITLASVIICIKKSKKVI